MTEQLMNISNYVPLSNMLIPSGVLRFGERCGHSGQVQSITGQHRGR